jgi:hypothetical protein
LAANVAKYQMPAVAQHTTYRPCRLLLSVHRINSPSVRASLPSLRTMITI